MNKDLCPYCSNKLETGTILPAKQSYIWWMPEGQAVPSSVLGNILIYNQKIIDKGGIVFKGETAFSNTRILTRVCKKCGLMLVWTDEAKANYNK